MRQDDLVEFTTEQLESLLDESFKSFKEICDFLKLSDDMLKEWMSENQD